MNPQLPDDLKDRRGTSRPDRTEKKETEAVPDGKKPARPAYLDKGSDAAWFWYRHIDQLWSEGWVTHTNLTSFILLCEEYNEYRQLQRDVSEMGRFWERPVKDAYVREPTPEWSEYRKVRASLEAHMREMGITGHGEKRRKIGVKPKKANKPLKSNADGDNVLDINDFVKRS